MAARIPDGAFAIPPGVDIAALMAALTGEPGSAPPASMNVNSTLSPLLRAAASDNVSEARCARGGDTRGERAPTLEQALFCCQHLYAWAHALTRACGATWAQGRTGAWR